MERIVAEKINTSMGFKVVELLGQGQSGKVYKCVRVDRGIIHKSAVKVIIIPESVELFTEEIEALIKLKHSPNIIVIEDYVRDVLPDGRVIILIRMELAKKVIFDEILCFSRQKRIEILLDIGKGIMDCEENGIIHGDIKPGNLFIAENGKYKLGDFGISGIASDAANGEGSAGGLTERFSENRGTPGFCTPELWRNGIRDRSTDIYSLGILGFMLFNDGLPPFLRLEESDSPVARERAFKKRINGAKMPSPIHGGDELSRIIRKATDFLPENRFSGSKEFCDEIKKLLEYECEFHGIDVDQMKENFEKSECINMGNYWNGDFVCKIGEIFFISNLVSGGLYSTSKCRKLHLLSKDYFIGENRTNLRLVDKSMLDMGRKCFRPIRHKDLIFHGGTGEDSGLYCTSGVSGSSYKLLETEMRAFTVFLNQLITADYDGMVRVYNLTDLEELFYKRNKGEIGNLDKKLKKIKEIKEIESVAGTNIEFICCVSGKIFMQSISGEFYIYERGTLLELNTSVLEPIT